MTFRPWVGWLIVVPFVALGAAAGLLAGLVRAPLYEASASVIVGRPASSASSSAEVLDTSRMLAATYADLATRRPVVEATVASLGLDEDWTSLVERIHADVPRRESPVVVIEALGESQTEAARLAGEVARQLVAFSPTGPEVERVAEVDAFVNSQLVQLEQRLRDLQAANERLKARLSRASGAKAGEIRSLLDANETFITNAQRNYASLLEVVAVGRVPNHVELLEEASASASPVRPGAIPLVVAGTGMGLLVGLGVRRAAARGTRRGPVSPASSPTGQDDRIAAPLAGRSAG